MRHLKLQIYKTKWCSLLKVVGKINVDENMLDFEASNFFSIRTSRHLGTYANYLNDKREIGQLHIAVSDPYIDIESDQITIVPSERWLKDCRIAIREFNEYYHENTDYETIE